MPTPSPLRILVVGQTPPPFGGQALMIEAFLSAPPPSMHMFHVRLAYSEDMESMGRFALRKVWLLFTTILRVWWGRLRYRTPMMYYPPSGPNMVPVLRDIVFLCATRWMFRWTVFHYHAGGVSGFRDRLPRVLRPLFGWAYRNAALAIRTAPQNPEDGRLLNARSEVVVPNGVADMRGTIDEHVAGPGESIVILFTGVMIPSKGVGILLEAFRQVVSKGGNAHLELMGKWGSEGFKAECVQFVEEHGLGGRVTFLGVKQGVEKWSHFAGCDIFCFPSFFEAESFGLVLLEAMQFAKPVVTTDWRGIPSVAQNGVNGIVVPIKDAMALAEALMRLIEDDGLRRRMGEAGRRIFVERFTLEQFRRNMENALIGATEKH